MISGPKPGSGHTRVHYSLDAWNRLVEVRTDDSGEPRDLIVEYEYDGTNRRVEKVVTGTSHAHYCYNQRWQVLEERFVDGQEATVASNQYVWSARYIDAPIARFHDGNGDGDLLDLGDNIRYYTGDANYNVTAVIAATTADVIERFVYTAYGTATVYSAAWTSPTVTANDGPFYGGYFYDVETGLYQVRNRYYDPSTSAFISRDLIEADRNLYSYVNNSPTNRLDPSGLVTVELRPPELASHPWSYEDMGEDLGMTRGYWLASCTCSDRLRFTIHCYPHFYWDTVARCKVIIITEITLSRRIPRDRKEGVYGHEQRHASNLRNYGEQLARQLTDMENQSFCGKEHCRREVKNVTDRLSADFNDYFEREAVHGNPEPLPHTDYPVIGTMPPPSPRRDF